MLYTDLQRVGDKRAIYYNPRWPWIHSVHRFRINHHYPIEFDIAQFKLPSAAVGNYIMHFKWGGYRDCTDINVYPVAVVNRYGSNASGTPYYVKLDHCEYTYVLNPVTPCTLMTNNSAQVCMNACTAKGSGCDSVQVARVTNPPGTLPYTPSIPTRRYTYDQRSAGQFPPPEYGACDSRTIHKRATAIDIANNMTGCQDFAQPLCNVTLIAQARPDQFVCYGLQPYRDQDFQVQEDYVIAREPIDPKFYSTCLKKIIPGGFLNTPVRTTPFNSWQVSDRGPQCLNCSLIAKVQAYSVDQIADWYPGLTNLCQNCDMQRGSCNPLATDPKYGSRASCGTFIPAGASCNISCQSGYKVWGGQRTCTEGYLRDANQVCVYGP